MAVEEGKFQLYSSITPPLEAGDWRLVVSQELSAQIPETALDNNDLKVDDAHINFRVRSPRYLMPPDQVLSTFPPANSFGSYGNRLPQVVIKRRTLPWERAVGDAPAGIPWLALVLIAEGEATLDTGIDVAECVTEGVLLDGVADVEKGNRLVVRKSVIDKVFPTRNDVDLLAHAREVDINDTELMMGDDDGFLAVVISNRLPLPGVDATGKEVPVKYMACLVNLEGQFNTLLERSPDPEPDFVTSFLNVDYALIENAAMDDHIIMGTAAAPDRINPAPIENTFAGPAVMAQSAVTGSTAYAVKSAAASSSGAIPGKGSSQWSSNTLEKLSSTEVSLQMARDFRFYKDVGVSLYDPVYRFPVLMHWSFTTTGSTTFRSLMEGLDSGLLGDVGEKPSDLSGRLPLEVVESGHVGLAHKTREGDDVRSWYRGPLVPHPTLSAATDRLPLAHSSDQLRIVIQDGREDLSLASAFEIGRLLSLSQPSIIASLMRWRQGHYYAARAAAQIEVNRPFWEAVLGADFVIDDFYKIGPAAGRFLIDSIVTNPETFFGPPRAPVTAGRPLEFDGLPTDLMAQGLGLSADLFRGDLGSMLEKVRMADIPFVDLKLGDLGKSIIRDGLAATLDNQRLDLVSGALANKFFNNPITGPAFPATGLNAANINLTPDVLDTILASTADDTDIPLNLSDDEAKL